MLKRLNARVFGLIHTISSTTYRRLGIDNYTWSAIFFVGAALASFYLYKSAMELAAVEENLKVAEMRRTSAPIGIIVFVMLAGYVLYFRKFIRKQAMRHYDLGKNLKPSATILPWMLVISYFASLPFSYMPGGLDMLLFGIGLMFLLAEPPPMEHRMDRAFRGYEPPV